MAHPRYRNYILFALTSVFMGIGAILLLQGVQALGQGEAAWDAYLASMASTPMRLLSLLVLGFTLYFMIRWAWLSRKIGAGRVGPIPGPGLPLPVLFLGLLVAFTARLIVTLMILGGVL